MRDAWRLKPLCPSCGRGDRLVSRAVGICVECIRSRGRDILEMALGSHLHARRSFDLPERPPRDPKGITCRICSQSCDIGVGEMGYCGLRWNDSGRLVSLSTPGQGIYHAYLDPHITNCCASWFCPAATGCGYPRFACKEGPELGYYNLAIFLYGCNFNCLFCQNFSHKEISTAPVHSIDELVKTTLSNERISCWCFFGGSPEPQLPFALNASRKVLDALKGERILRICFEWNGCGNPELVKRAVAIAYHSGGNVKFDLKAWSDDLSIALSGVSNRIAYQNFRMVANQFRAGEEHPPWLCATTLLVPGYVDAVEVEGIARFIAEMDPQIPYELLIFHPNFMMRDLPVTPLQQIKECCIAARKHLERVNVANLHLISSKAEEIKRYCSG